MAEQNREPGPDDGGLGAELRSDAELIGRAGDAFTRDAEALDEITRQRLSAARRLALDELETPTRSRAFAWAPVGAAAVVAIAAVGVALVLRTPSAPPAPGADDGRTTEMELLLGDDDPALYDEEPDFYAWAAEQADDAG